MPSPDLTIDVKELSRAWQMQTDVLKRQYSLANILQHTARRRGEQPGQVLQSSILPE